MNPLIEDIKSGDEKRANAAKARLQETMPAELLPALLALAVGQNDPLASECATNVVASFGDNDAIVSFISNGLSSKDPDVREEAARLLMDAPQSKLVATARKCAEGDEQEGVRILCLHTLRNLAWNTPGSEGEFVSVWLKAIGDKNAGIRGAGYECLSHVRDRKFDAVIAKSLTDPDNTIRSVYAPLWQKNGGRS